MFSKLTEAQKQFFETGRTRDLAFRICQLQLLADAMRKNETVLEEALKKDLGKSAFESYATEIGFVLADIRYSIKSSIKAVSHWPLLRYFAHLLAVCVRKIAGAFAARWFLAAGRWLSIPCFLVSASCAAFC